MMMILLFSYISYVHVTTRYLANGLSEDSLLYMCTTLLLSYYISYVYVTTRYLAGLYRRTVCCARVLMV